MRRTSSTHMISNAGFSSPASRAAVRDSWLQLDRVAMGSKRRAGHVVVQERVVVEERILADEPGSFWSRCNGCWARHNTIVVDRAVVGRRRPKPGDVDRAARSADSLANSVARQYSRPSCVDWRKSCPSNGRTCCQ